MGTTHPELVADWHPTKNTEYSYTEVLAGTAKKAWWKAACGHEWETRINARTMQNQKCPVCFGKAVATGENDLQTVYPDIAAQWHVSKNDNLTPDIVHKHSAKKVWWLCEEGHEWQTAVFMRTLKNSGCTVCETRGGKQTPLTAKEQQARKTKKEFKSRVNPGVNDLYTVSPTVAKQWHPTKNGDLTPLQVSAYSTQVAWWQGECGHEWDNQIVHQTRRGTCPYCSGKRFKTGYNDIETLYPEIAKQWSSKNSSKPSETKAGTNNKVHWVCDKGHEWEASINRRILGSGCPFCSNRKLAVGENDLLSQYREIADEYHPTKNEESVETISAHSTKKIWWICDKGHEWKNSPYNRTYNRYKEESFIGNGCPVCSKPVSKAEQEIYDYVISLGFTDAVQSDRTVLNGQEIDIFIPSLNIGIEYNGLYWHAERNGKGQKYHLNKWLAAKRNGVQLIQIWEDDWRDKKILWKGMLAKKLGVANRNTTVYARKTKIKEFLYGAVKDYMDNNHLQGAMFGTKYLGLVDSEGQLVCLLVVTSKKDGVLEVTRFMASHHVPGGFSKLLKHAVSLFPDTKTIVSFSENSISAGNLYEKTGFTNEGSFTAYSYISKTNPPVREHRRHYTKQKYQSRADLEYIEGYTERQLADLNGLDRVWDAGNTKWVKEL